MAADLRFVSTEYPISSLISRDTLLTNLAAYTDTPYSNNEVVIRTMTTVPKPPVFQIPAIAPVTLVQIDYESNEILARRINGLKRILTEHMKSIEGGEDLPVDQIMSGNLGPLTNIIMNTKLTPAQIEAYASLFATQLSVRQLTDVTINNVYLQLGQSSREYEQIQAKPVDVHISRRMAYAGSISSRNLLVDQRTLSQPSSSWVEGGRTVMPIGLWARYALIAYAMSDDTTTFQRDFDKTQAITMHYQVNREDGTWEDHEMPLNLNLIIQMIIANGYRGDVDLASQYNIHMKHFVYMDKLKLIVQYKKMDLLQIENLGPGDKSFKTHFKTNHFTGDLLKPLIPPQVPVDGNPTSVEHYGAIIKSFQGAILAL